MYLGIAILFYILGSVVMNGQLSNVWRERGGEFENDSIISIHLLSILWPATIVLGFVFAIILALKRSNGTK